MSPGMWWVGEERFGSVRQVVERLNAQRTEFGVFEPSFSSFLSLEISLSRPVIFRLVTSLLPGYPLRDVERTTDYRLWYASSTTALLCK